MYIFTCGVVLHSNIDEMVFKTCVCYSWSVSLITHFSGCCGSRLSCWRSWSPVCWQLEKLEGRGGRRPSPSQRRGRTWQSWARREKIASQEASWSATKTSRPSSQAPWLCKLGRSIKMTGSIKRSFSGFATTGSWKKWKHLLVSSLPVDCCPSANTRFDLPFLDYTCYPSHKLLKLLYLKTFSHPSLELLFRVRSTAKGTM